MHTNVVAMADKIIIPTRLEFLSAIGVAEVLNTISAISQHPDMEAPDLLGVLPFQYNVNTFNENKASNSQYGGVGGWERQKRESQAS